MILFFFPHSAFTPKFDLAPEWLEAWEEQNSAWEEESGWAQQLSNLEVRMNHDHLNRVSELTCASGCALSQKVFIWAVNTLRGPSVSTMLLGTFTSSSPDCSSVGSVTAWSVSKKSLSEILPTKRQGRQLFRPCFGQQVMWQWRQTNCPTGERKTLTQDVTEERATGWEWVLLPDSMDI